MSLSAGTRLGPYEITAPLGAGGMGEVYKARDTRLGRDVALKTLPAEFSADESRRLRFEQEARVIAALNHPNIVAVHDIGTENGVSYIITELVDGEPLRGAKFGLRKTLDIAVQIASGLAAAHAAGVVHRDLKPDNILLTRDNRVKILDFGLAKFRDSRDAPAATLAATLAATETVAVRTEPGAVMGTVGYMSPEQVRGADADYRSDIFSFGVVLYEMLSGERAFRGETSVETMTAILRHDPPDLPETVPAAARQIVMHCLEKDPGNRYQSARDIGFSLESLATVSSAGTHALAAIPSASRWRKPLIGAAALALLAGAFVAGRESGPAGYESPVYSRLTFRRGSVFSARFTPDGQSIVYAAAWDGNPTDLFVTRREFPESRALGVPNASLQSISSSGELAVLIGPLTSSHFARGTLARLPLAGGSPREVLEDVSGADWSPDGKELAVVHHLGNKDRLEYPIGKVLYETAQGISWPRVSPKGDRIAVFEHPLPGDDRGFVAMVDLAGKKTRLVTAESSSQEGLAWSPAGDEIWFAAQYDAGGRALHAVSLEGRQRVILRIPGRMLIEDLGRDGAVLMVRDDERNVLMGFARGDSEERDLTWLGDSVLSGFSADGRLLLFGEENPVVGPNYAVCVRKMDGSPPIRLGEGNPIALSPDGKWAISEHPSRPGYTFLPVGAGAPRALEAGAVQISSRPYWFPDSRRVSFAGAESGHKPRCYVESIDPGAQPQPATPEDTLVCAATPDGTGMVALSSDAQLWIYPLDGSPRRPVKGITSSDEVAGFTADGRGVYIVRRQPTGFAVDTLDVGSGQHKPFREVRITDRAGFVKLNSVALSLDGSSCAYAYKRILSELYLAGGLK